MGKKIAFFFSFLLIFSAYADVTVDSKKTWVRILGAGKKDVDISIKSKSITTDRTYISGYYDRVIEGRKEHKHPLHQHLNEPDRIQRVPEFSYYIDSLKDEYVFAKLKVAYTNKPTYETVIIRDSVELRLIAKKHYIKGVTFNVADIATFDSGNKYKVIDLIWYFDRNGKVQEFKP